MNKFFRFFIVVFLVMTWSSSFSGSDKATCRKKIEEGNYLFLEKNYPKALETYLEAYAIDSNNANVNYATSSFWLFNAAYFRFTDASLGYTFKPGLLSHIGAKNARLYLSGTNLFTVSHFPKGWDPEIIQGYNTIVKTYIIGVRVNL